MAYLAGLFLLVIAAAIGCSGAHGDDANTTSVASDITRNSDFFTYTGLRQWLWSNPKGSSFKLSLASQAQYPALNGQSVSLAILQFPAGSVNPPHTHIRSAELLLVLKGWLQVGLVDSNNKLYTQTLHPGDSFVFPKGLVHFQMNNDQHLPAVAVAAFGSSEPGAISLPAVLFGTGIDKYVLAKSFKTDIDTVGKIIWANTKTWP